MKILISILLRLTKSFIDVHSTLAEAVDKALETRNFHNVYELIEVPGAAASH